MKQEMLFTARTVELALGEAGMKLGVAREKLEYEIIEREKTGFFGIGASPAKIKVFVEIAETVDEPEPEKSPESKPDPKPEPKPEPALETSQPQPSATSVKASEEAAVTEESETDSETEVKPTDVQRGCGDHAAKEFIETLLADMEIDAKVEMTRTRKSDRAITVTGDAAGVLIGHHGDTLDALQYLANLAANKREEDESRDYVHITVDIENYRAKRETALRALARRMADKVSKSGKPVMLEPMTPYERRIIHSEVQSIEGVSTNSVGADSDRRVVIYLESAGFSVPEDTKPQRSDRRPPQKRGGKGGRYERSDSRQSRSERQEMESRSDTRRDKPKAPAKPLHNDEGERMSAEEVNELVATYGAKETKEKTQREQPAKFKSFEDYMNSILGETGGSEDNTK